MVPRYVLPGWGSSGKRKLNREVSILAKFMLLVYVDSKDPSREAELNDWYNNTHLPDLVKFPEISSATRYVNDDPGAGPGKFLATYDIETDDIEKTIAALKDYLAKLRESGRYSDLLVRVSFNVFRQTKSLKK